MESVKQNEYDAILTQIKQWTPDQRFTLIQELLHSLKPAVLQEEKHHTLAEALGLLVTEQETPNDETIQTWLRERRMERYG